MPQRKRPQPTAKLTQHAAQLLLNASSKLKPDRVTLTRLDQAAADLKETAEHLDQATACTEQEPSTAIILRAAANAASAAKDHLAQAHQDLEDAYITDQGGTSPQAIKATLRKAAAAALKETQSALELLNEEGTTNTDPPFAPPELTEARHNKAILAICAAALIITAALAVYNTQTFAQTAAVAAFACQQAIMFWAFMASTRTRGHPQENGLLRLRRPGPHHIARRLPLRQGTQPPSGAATHRRSFPPGLSGMGSRKGQRPLHPEDKGLNLQRMNEDPHQDRPTRSRGANPVRS